MADTEAPAAPAAQPFCWGDEEDDDFLAEEEGRFESAPDGQGIKTITDIQVREDGKKMKITKRVKVVKRTIKVNKRAEDRLKKWVPFGKAKENSIDITVKEQDIPFDISGNRKTVQSVVEKKIDEEIVKMMRTSANKAEGLGDTDKYIPKSLRPGGGRSTDPIKPGAGAAVTENTYRPPSMRGGEGVGGRSMSSRDDPAHTVRVTNLSEDITEQDLRDLFGTYGALQRVFLAKDRTTRESKGFAFINFYNKQDAERAIEKVSGFGYNHLILQVEWAKPSGN